MSFSISSLTCFDNMDTTACDFVHVSARSMSCITTLIFWSSTHADMQREPCTKASFGLDQCWPRPGLTLLLLESCWSCSMTFSNLRGALRYLSSLLISLRSKCGALWKNPPAVCLHTSVYKQSSPGMWRIQSYLYGCLVNTYRAESYLLSL